MFYNNILNNRINILVVQKYMRQARNRVRNFEFFDRKM